MAENVSYNISNSPAWRWAIRRVARRLLAWRYRHFVPGSQPDTTVKVGNIRLRVFREVFDPSIHFTSGVLARYIRRSGVVPAGSSVLDMGTGTGVAAIAAGLAGAGRVVAADINPAAVRCAALNIRRYRLGDTVTVREGDLFATVRGEQFNLVICNPPYFNAQPQTMAERAYHAGSNLEWLRRFGVGLHTVLAPQGSSIISLGDAADIDAILRLFNECGWSHTEVARRDILVETIYLFQLTKTNGSSSRAE